MSNSSKLLLEMANVVRQMEYDHKEHVDELIYDLQKANEAFTSLEKERDEEVGRLRAELNGQFQETRRLQEEVYEFRRQQKTGKGIEEAKAMASPDFVKSYFGNAIGAIKALRNSTDIGLREAKDIWDAAVAQYQRA